MTRGESTALRLGEREARFITSLVRFSMSDRRARLCSSLLGVISAWSSFIAQMWGLGQCFVFVLGRLEEFRDFEGCVCGRVIVARGAFYAGCLVAFDAGRFASKKVRVLAYDLSATGFWVHLVMIGLSKCPQSHIWSI